VIDGGNATSGHPARRANGDEKEHARDAQECLRERAGEHRSQAQGGEKRADQVDAPGAPSRP